LSLSACATSGVPSDAATTVLSFEELDCGDCGDHMARAMIGVDGVYKTKFDKRRAELTIVASPKLDVFAIAQKNKPAGEEWSLALGAGKGRYKAWAKAPEQADVLEIAVDGADVADLAAHLAKGKVTPVRLLGEVVRALPRARRSPRRGAPRPERPEPTPTCRSAGRKQRRWCRVASTCDSARRCSWARPATSPSAPISGPSARARWRRLRTTTTSPWCSSRTASTSAMASCPGWAWICGSHFASPT
jgi:hypothetical protein